MRVGLRGRARVYNQGGDSDEVIDEAIDTCPVMCISYVDLEDLVILETEREGITINPASIGVPRTWAGSTSALAPTKAKLGGGGSDDPGHADARGALAPLPHSPPLPQLVSILREGQKDSNPAQKATKRS